MLRSDRPDGGEHYLLSTELAAKSLCVSLTTLKSLIAKGQIKSVCLGKRRLLHPTDVQAFANSLRARRDEAAPR